MIPTCRRASADETGTTEAPSRSQWDGEEAVGVILAEVGLRREGELAQVIERAELVRVEADLLEPLPVERDVADDARERRLEPLELQLLELRPVHALALRLPDPRVGPVHGATLFSASRSLPRYARCTSRFASSSSAVPCRTMRPVSST